jgi:hypothetical protein
MAGSTQAELETLFEDIVLQSERTTSTSDPTNTLVTTFINKAILEIATTLEPQELLDSTAATANITVNTNTVDIPTTYIKPKHVYYKNSSGKFSTVSPRTLKSLIDGYGSSKFFDTTHTGRPVNYAVRGDKLIFDYHFDRTETGAIKLFGLLKPTELSTASASTQTELPKSYDLLIVYKAAIYFYERDEDEAMLRQYRGLAAQEEARLRLALMTTNELVRVELDPRTFTDTSRGIDHPDVFFQ